MSKLSHSSVSNLEEEENDRFDFDDAPQFGGGGMRDATMKIQTKRKGRSSLTAGSDFKVKKKRDNSSNRGGGGGADNLHESGSK